MHKICKIVQLIALILCLNGITANVRSSDESAVSPNRHATTANGVPTLKLTHLNCDVLFLIFYPLEFPNLLSLIQTSSKFAIPINYIYRQKFHNHNIIIHYVNERELKERRMFYCHDYMINGNCVILYKHELILNILKYLGSSIKSLTINDELDGLNSNEFISTTHQFINEYASESLRSLVLGRIRDDTLAKFTKPFNEIEDFDFKFYVKQIGTVQALNELFPKLKRLSMFFNADMDSNYFDCEFRHLTDLDVSIGWKRNEPIDALIQRNPQITSINLNFNNFPANYI